MGTPRKAMGMEYGTFTMRLPKPLIDRVTAYGLELGLSRTQVIEKTLALAMDMYEATQSKGAKQATLFDSWLGNVNELLEAAVQKGIDEAMNRGGIELGVKPRATRKRRKRS